MTDQHPVFIPGPTNIPDRLRCAMNVQTRDHRAPEFARSLPPLLDRLRPIFGTQSAEVLTFPATGTAGWEAAITNTLSPGDAVLVARNGMFSHRWIDMCQRHGLDVRVIECVWGTGAPADRIAVALQDDASHAIKAVLVTHNETATGVRSDIAAVRAALDGANHPALLFVDAVSSLASMPFAMDAWCVDIAISGSQKGLMLNAGLAILAMSPRVEAAMANARLPRTFLDIAEMRRANAAGGYPYTPPMQLLHGLAASLDMLDEEGLPQVFARHRRLAAGVRAAVDAWGLQIVARTPDLYSDTVTAIYVPEGFDADRLVAHTYNTYRVSFGAGLGELAGKAFRIGHLGALSDVMVLSGLATLEMAMADLGYPIRLGAGVAAAQDYFRGSLAAAPAAAA